MTNVGLLPGTDSLDVDDRRHRRRHPHGHEPLLVDRRQAAELPVRLRDRLGDQGRQARPAAEEPDLHRHQPALLGLARHARRTRRVDVLGDAELRQGPALSRSATRAIPPSRPGSAGSGSGSAGERRRPPTTSARRRSTAAERASSSWSAPGRADAEAEVTVRQGTEALTRFATSFIHQNVAEDVSHVLLRVALDGRVASTSLDGPADDERARPAGRRRLEAARVAPARSRLAGPRPADSAAPAVDHWDEATATAAPDDRAERVASSSTRPVGSRPPASARRRRVHVAFANSAGQRADRPRDDGRDRRHRPDADRRRERPPVVGPARPTSTGAQSGERAAAKARTATDPTDLAPGSLRGRSSNPTASPNILVVPARSTGSTAGRSRRAARSPGSASRNSTRRSRSATTSPTRDARAPVRHRGNAEATARSRPRRRDTALLHTRRTAARRAGAESTGHARRGRWAVGRARGEPRRRRGEHELAES